MNRRLFRFTLRLVRTSFMISGVPEWALARARMVEA